MSARSEWPVALACLLMPALGACQPKIGDDCHVSTDCGYGSRICDITQPGGYCTLFNCEPGGCPDESICIAYHAFPSVAQGCLDPQGSTRLARSFCMRRCTSRGDCRGSYQCLDMNTADNPWGASVLEHGRVDGRVCMVPHSGASMPSDIQTGICQGTDGGFDALPPPEEDDAQAPADALAPADAQAPADAMAEDSS